MPAWISEEPYASAVQHLRDNLFELGRILNDMRSLPKEVERLRTVVAGSFGPNVVGLLNQELLAEERQRLAAPKKYPFPQASKATCAVTSTPDLSGKYSPEPVRLVAHTLSPIPFELSVFTYKIEGRKKRLVIEQDSCIAVNAARKEEKIGCLSTLIENLEACPHDPFRVIIKMRQEHPVLDAGIFNSETSKLLNELLLRSKIYIPQKIADPTTQQYLNRCDGQIRRLLEEMGTPSSWNPAENLKLAKIYDIIKLMEEVAKNAVLTQPKDIGDIQRDFWKGHPALNRHRFLPWGPSQTTEVLYPEYTAPQPTR